MKGFVIKWRMTEFDDYPLFSIYQVPYNTVTDFCEVETKMQYKKDEYPFSYIECQIIANNKKQAISRFAKKYGVQIKGNKSFEYKY